MAETAPIDIPVLDPRNERDLVEQALVRAFNASGGALNDFSSSSIVRAHIEGQAFAAAELLFYVNQLPLALVLNFLKVSGVERKLGTQATASVTFTLTQPLTTPFTVPQGFFLSDSTGKVTFATDAILVIPPNAISGTTTVTCTETGTVGNLPAYTINRFSQPLTYLSTVINTAPATGGTNEESQDSAILRGLNAIRRRNIVTADDYEQEAKAALGEGSVARAIGLLSGDRISYQLGAVHLFCLNPDGSQPNSTQLNNVQNALASKIQIGTSLYVSAIDLLNVDADLTAALLPGEDPNTVAQSLWAAYQEYLAPTQFEVGKTIILKEVEFALRLSGSLLYIQALTLNGQGTNLPLPYRYSLPKAHSLFMSLIDDSGNIYKILKGAGESYI